MMRRRGVVDELTDYLKKNIQKGYSRESLHWALVNQGYSRLEVAKALESLDRELPKETQNLGTKPHIEHRIISNGVESQRKSFWSRFFS